MPVAPNDIVNESPLQSSSLLVMPSPSESTLTSVSHEYPRASDSGSTAVASRTIVSSVNLVNSMMGSFTEGGVAS